MIRLETKLVSNDGTLRERVTIEIPPDEWNTLCEFHEDVERLRSTRFVQNGRGGQIAIKWEQSRGVRANAKPVDEDEVWAMLLKLRPFVLQREAHYFHRIQRTLKRRLTHPAFRRHLELLADAFSLRTMQNRIALRGSGRPLLSTDVVLDWLNSHEYHNDKTKREAVKVDLGILAHDQNGLPVVLFALVDMIQSILHLGDLVETLSLIECGKLLEITCPMEFLDGV